MTRSPSPLEKLKRLLRGIALWRFVRRFTSGHRWDYRNPARRVCTQCGIQQCLWAEEYEVGPLGSGRMRYENQTWEPVSPICSSPNSN